jgi:ketosteroid isomerase-like protein
VNSNRSRAIWPAIVFTTGLVLLLAAATSWRAVARAGGDRDGDKRAMDAVLNAQQAAWNRGDVDAFVDGYWHSPEVSFSGSNGTTRGWEGVRDHYKERYADRAAMGQLDFSELEFHFLGPDAAFVLGHWHLKRASGDVGGVFTLVWQRFPDGWKIIHDHTSQTP